MADLGRTILDKDTDSSPPLDLTENIFSEVYSIAILCSATGSS